MPRYCLTIAHDGTDFCGWQKQEPPAAHSETTGSGRHVDPTLETTQPGRIALRTVQAIVERAVREVVREPVELKGSSRTDSGVHAKGQVAAFTCSGDMSTGFARCFRPRFFTFRGKPSSLGGRMPWSARTLRACSRAFRPS